MADAAPYEQAHPKQDAAERHPAAWLCPEGQARLLATALGTSFYKQILLFIP